MKRYKMETSPDKNGDWWTEPIESDDGEWVKYEDVKDRRELLGKIKDLKLKIISIKSPECNCEFTVLDMIKSNPNQKIFNNTSYWICPAHGYKKI